MREKRHSAVRKRAGVLLVHEPHPRHQVALVHILERAHQPVLIVFPDLGEIIKHDLAADASIFQIRVGDHDLGAVRRDGDIHLIAVAA